MSKKHLAKTAIEGGRHGFNTWERRHSHNQERRSSKEYCQKVLVDPELADEIDIEDKEKVYKEFSDKLSPVFRWLRSKVGQPWAEVRSEISKKFDSRTTAGRHILYDHLLSSVVDTQSGFNQYGYIVDPSIEIANSDGTAPNYYRRAYHDFYVDQQGILCRVTHDKVKKVKYKHITEPEYKEAGDWLNGSMIIEKGGVLSWACPMEGLWKASWLDPNGKQVESYKLKLGYYLFDNGLHKAPGYSDLFWEVPGDPRFTGKVHSDYWNLIENPFSFRQRGQLSDEEVKFFKSLKSKLQKEILEYSKGR
jgi:hypothetical protein